MIIDGHIQAMLAMMDIRLKDHYETDNTIGLVGIVRLNFCDCQRSQSMQFLFVQFWNVMEVSKYLSALE